MNTEYLKLYCRTSWQVPVCYIPYKNTHSHTSSCYTVLQNPVAGNALYMHSYGPNVQSVFIKFRQSPCAETTRPHSPQRQVFKRFSCWIRRDSSGMINQTFYMLLRWCPVKKNIVHKDGNDKMVDCNSTCHIQTAYISRGVYIGHACSPIAMRNKMFKSSCLP